MCVDEGKGRREKKTMFRALAFQRTVDTQAYEHSRDGPAIRLRARDGVKVSVLDKTESSAGYESA